MAAKRIDVMWALLRKACDRETSVRLALAAVLALTGASLSALAPIALQRTVDLLGGGEAHTAVLLAAIYLAVLVGARLCDLAQAYAYATGDQRLQRRLARAAQQHLLRLPMRFHEKYAVGELIQANARAAQGVRTLVSQVGFILSPALVQMAIILVVVAGVFDASLWTVVALASSAYAAVFAWGVQRLLYPSREAIASQLRMSGLFADALAGVEAMKGAVAEKRTDDRFDAALAHGEALWRRVHRRRGEAGILVALVFATSLAAALSLGVSGVAAGRLTAGEFILLSAYMLQIVRPLEMVGVATRDLAQCFSNFERWAEILAVRPEPFHAIVPKGLIGAQDGPPLAVKFAGVSFGYERGRPVLSGIDFVVPAGGVTAIVGPSGAGKTSLLRLLLQHESPCSGEIRLGETRLSALNVQAMRELISVVNQNVVLFNDTLRENLLFAKPDVTTEALQHAICVAQLDELVLRLPQGLDTHVGERGLKLSGGERQRVAIARAVLRDTPVLVLDEATSAQDAQSERAILEGLLNCGRKRTILIITHRLALAARADAIILLENGRIAERGAHDDLVNAGGIYGGLWRLQSEQAAPRCDLAGRSGSLASIERWRGSG